MSEPTRHIEVVMLLIFTGIGLFFISCGKDTGEIVTRDVELSRFDTLELNAVFDVEIIEGDHYSLQIKGVKELTDDLTFMTDHNRLRVENKNLKLWIHPKNDPPVLTITCIGLARIEVNETCNIKSLNTITTDTFGILLGGKLNFADLTLDCNLFYYWNSSPNGGLLSLKGKSQLVGIYNSNLMAVDASQLICDLATVENGSKAGIHVFVRKKLDYSISGTGNIYLMGNPDEIVAHRLSSTGRLIQ